ncbi:uncharacterized protein B0I36DRAFT_332319 [Microdochium trichocladiopsis]|uniref:Zn(2)-C6 fungal-type domain-containing protein n=1 Tax=Microdochium trichocladiopsis TaxID=1682393 RepID=A0A9P9BM07_9PEZI|nr:uncharacterized protein B0I36DRAFT_332319 [Microdochium trichocladiopsis]KAH7024970.1 hypothetical protein B0I36DRAFT_332319 [Microdochium trichocladiopsis]
MNPFRVLSTKDFDPEIPGYRRRVKHAKSTTGCIMCKAKRVKCDEAKPVCARCHRNRRVCRYPQAPAGVLAMPSPPSSDDDVPGTPSRQLLHHCQTHWADIFPGFDQNEAFLSTFKSSPLVRSVCHAIAASHLRFVHPPHQPHVLAEYSHRAVALDAYKQQLGLTAAQLGQSGVNAMLLGAMLFSLLAFPLSPAEHEARAVSSRSPWLTRDHDADLGWLTFQAGVGPLMRSVLRYLPRACQFLITIFSPQAGGAMFPNVALQPPPVPRLWAQFFELDEEDLFAQSSVPATASSSSTPTSGPPPLASSVRLLVRMTALVRGLEPTPANSVAYLSFMFKAQRDFRALLLTEHPRAWWLYGYWAGLMRRFPNLWWCRERADGQYASVKEWLARVDVDRKDRKIWGQMMDEYHAASEYPPPELEMVFPPDEEEAEE